MRGVLVKVVSEWDVDIGCVLTGEEVTVGMYLYYWTDVKIVKRVGEKKILRIENFVRQDCDREFVVWYIMMIGVGHE